MRTEPELLNERLDRLALVLDEIMPNCANLVRDALDLLKEQEAVEPVKLVRCKNCKHCDSERIDKNMIWCKIHQFGRPDDYYCADGIEKQMTK